jgi:hypothetical protein
MAFYLPALFLVVLGLLPKRALKRRAAFAGAVLMLVFFGLSAAAIFGPESDTSFQLSNWDAKQNAHGLFVAVFVIELAAVALFLLLAGRRATARTIRLACLSCGLCALLITFALAVALGN